MSSARVIACYALLGPLIGASVVVVGSLASEPDLRDDTMQLAAAAFAFAYPLGLLPATLSGVVHAMLVYRLRTWSAAAAVCVSGVLATLLVAGLIGNPATVFQSPFALFAFACPPVVSSGILFWVFRAHTP